MAVDRDARALRENERAVARDEQVAVIRDLAAHLRPDGRFVVVEYDVDRGNPWVPHPFSYGSWHRLAEAAGLVDTHSIGRVPSRFLDAIYSAESRRPGVADRR